MKKKKKLLLKQKKEGNIWHFFVLFSIAVFLFLRFFLDGLSHPTFNFFWNIYFFLLFITYLIRQKLKTELFKEEVVILLFFLFSVISSGLAPVKSSGIVYNAQMLGYICFFSVIVHNLNSREMKLLCWVLLFSSLCISLYGIYQYFWGLEETRQIVGANPEIYPPTFISRLASDRIFATFVYPNVYASFLLFVIPASFFMFLSSEKKVIGFLSLAILILAFVNLILTGSFGGILICLFTAICMLLFLIVKDRKKLGIIILCLLSLHIAVISAVYITGKLPKISSFADRVGYWQSAVKIFYERPVLGAGPGNYMYNYARFKSPDGMEAKHAHSIFFETLAETGIVGTLLLFSFVVLLMTYFFKKDDTSPLGVGIGFAMLAFLLHNMVDFSFIDPAVGILLFLGGATGIVLTGKKTSLTNLQLTKWLNCFMIIMVFLTALNYARYISAEKNLLQADKEKFLYSRLLYIETAEKLFSENFQVYEKKGDVYLNEAIRSQNKEYYKRAKNFYLSSLALNPYSSKIYRKMAFICEEIGDMCQAEKMYLKVIENYPAKKQYYLEAAVFYKRQGNKKMFEYYYEKSRYLSAATTEEEYINAAYTKWIESQK